MYNSLVNFMFGGFLLKVFLWHYSWNKAGTSVNMLEEDFSQICKRLFNFIVHFFEVVTVHCKEILIYVFPEKE